MNLTRILCGIALVVSASVSVSAQDQIELDSLLGELTYGDSDSPAKQYAQTAIPSAPSTGNIDSINQLPPPSLQDAGMIEADAFPSAPSPIDSGQFDARTLEIPRQDLSNQNPVVVPKPQQNAQPQPPVYPQAAVDSSAAHGEPLSSAYPQPDPYSNAQHHPSPDGCSTLRIASAGCASGACRPHQQPNLPPPSTIRQYFNTPNCYSNLWAGYAQEAQHRCDVCHKHIHGTCKCAEHGKSRHGCSSCSSHKCSQCD